jgi:transposase
LVCDKKTTVGAHERDETARADWRDRAATLPARKVVVLDESSTHLDMLRRYGRAPRGQRVYVKQRRNYGKNMSLLAGLRLDGMTEALVIEGAVTTPVFEAFVEYILLPTFHPGDIVVLDNLSVHKSSRVETLLHQRGCQILFLPTYAPDFSPIEQAFSKIKQFLRTARAQTADTLIQAIADALSTITPDDAMGFFTDAGFLNLD